MSQQSPLRLADDEQLLTGWGRTSPSLAKVVPVSTVEEVQKCIEESGPRGVLARGLGRSYGDAAQSGGASVIDLQQMSSISLNASTGAVTVGTGVSFHDLLLATVPAGFFVPVSPGTRMVTIGGAIAADVHGKNHHVEGSFGNHVQEIKLVNGLGELRALNPDDAQSQEQFWATVGGMGLTGVMTEATFKMIPISSSLISVDTERCADLDEVMARMIESDSQYRYSVAWIDSVSASGRGVITRGDHATRDQLPEHKRATALAYGPKALAKTPGFIPSGLLNKFTVRAFNEVWYRKAPKHEQGALQPISEFFHPLDFVADWNRVYGPAGFVQYQFVVPDEAGEVIGTALRKLQSIGAPSFLTVLKRFGTANPAPLSFPQAGWTLAADVPAGIPGLAAALDELDELVANAGGRLYLAKDSRQSPEMFARTYPRLKQWQRTRDQMDPKGIFKSDLARRLSL